MFSASNKFTWLVWLLVAGFVLSTGVWADDEDDEDEEEDEGTWYTIKGQGRSEMTATGDAWRKAMLRFLKENLDSADYEGNLNKLQKFIEENSNEYKSGKPRVIKKFRDGSITVAVQLQEELLLKDAKFKVVRTREKLEGMKIVLVSEMRKEQSKDIAMGDSDEVVDRNVMFDTVTDRLIKAGAEIYDLREIDEMMKKEALMTGQSAVADPMGYVAKQHGKANIVVFLWMTTQRVNDVAGPTWFATVGCRGVSRQTGQEFWRFEQKSGPVPTEIGMGIKLKDRDARGRAIKDASEKSADRVDQQIKTRKLGILEDNAYIVKFKNFDARQSDKIKNAIVNLGTGKKKYCKIEEGGGGSGVGDMEFKIVWTRDAMSQVETELMIKDYCLEEGVSLNSSKSFTGVIIFEPQSSRDE